MIVSILEFFSYNNFFFLKCQTMVYFTSDTITTKNLENEFLNNSYNVYLDKFYKFPCVEENANLTLIKITTNFWSIMTFENLFFYFLFFILILPLIYCLLSLFFFLKNQIRSVQMGKINLYEYKNPNFTILTKDYWRVLWCYAYDIVIRYTEVYPYKEFSKDYFRNDKKYPNPRTSLAFFFKIFLKRDKPRYLPYLIYYTLLIILFYFQDLPGLTVIFFCYLLFRYLRKRNREKRWSWGWHYHR